MIGLVVEHPEVQKKLHQELDDVLGTINWAQIPELTIFIIFMQTIHLLYMCVRVNIYLNVGDSGRVTLKLKDQLTYTSAVVHEAIRLKTVVPIGVPHMTTRNTSLRKTNQLTHFHQVCSKLNLTQFG